MDLRQKIVTHKADAGHRIVNPAGRGWSTLEICIRFVGAVYSDGSFGDSLSSLSLKQYGECNFGLDPLSAHEHSAINRYIGACHISAAIIRQPSNNISDFLGGCHAFHGYLVYYLFKHFGRHGLGH